MSFLLVLVLIAPNGDTTERDWAILSSHSDCRTTGNILAKDFNRRGGENVMLFDCKPI